MAATSIQIDEELKGRIQHLATTRHRSAQSMMREAIQQYVEREEKREAFKQDASRAWEDYQATGLHATGEEVVAWLETWGTDDEKTPPECHK